MDNKPFRGNTGGDNPKRRGIKNIGFFAIILLIALVVFATYSQPSNLKEAPFSEVISSANKGEIKQITIDGNDLQVTKKGEDKPSVK